MIPLTIVGGYLGSGKTTLLNHVLQQAGGKRLAVVVNDFGSIAIDGRLIKSREGDVVALANGCVCCSISAGFAETLTALARRAPPPEHVIVENSGIADPAKVARYGALPPYRLDGIVVLADAESVRARSSDLYVGESVLRQLRGADVVVLNKMDLVPAGQQPALRTWLHALVPDARIVETSHGRVPLETVLGCEPGRTVRLDSSGDAHAPYRTWNVASDEPVAETAFRADVESWLARVLRAKGYVYVAEDPSRRYLFQLVGRRWSLVPDGEWTSDPRTEIVIIALEET